MDKKTKWQYFRQSVKKNRTFYLMILPFMLFFTTFTVYPVFKAIWYSFTDYNVLQEPNFVGLKNYAELILHDSIFTKGIQNTFIIAIFVGPIGYVFSFLIAWLINELPHWLGTIVTVLFYLPSLAGGALTVFKLLFSNDSRGFVNAWLLKQGIIDEPVLWLTNEKTILLLVILISIWGSLGLGFLGFVAGMKNVQQDQYEAAAIDGIRNRWQELWYITLPNMKGQLKFGAVMSITGSLGVGAVGDALVGFPSPSYASHTIVNHLNDYGNIRLEMGRASAIAVILFVIMVVSNLLVQKLLRKVGT